MDTSSQTDTYDVVLFDYGGVLAEEGFKAGIAAIARQNGLDEQAFKQIAFDTVYGAGFTTGHIDEAEYWHLMRSKSGITGSDRELTDEILNRFQLRPYMIEIVSKLKKRGNTVAILSDQTHWLDELDRRDDFFRLFDHVFNSYHLGKTKKDKSVFSQVLKVVGCDPAQALFIDDHLEHIERARSAGLQAVHYVNREDFQTRLAGFFPGI